MGTSQNASSDSSTKRWQLPRRAFLEDLAGKWDRELNVLIAQSASRLCSLHSKVAFCLPCKAYNFIVFFHICYMWAIQVTALSWSGNTETGASGENHILLETLSLCGLLFF